MGKRVGTKLKQSTHDKPFEAYLPPDLPPTPPINMDPLYPLLERASVALAELNQAANAIPNLDLFITMHVRKEAVLSSQIEGTQCSLSDLMLFESQQTPTVTQEDVEEVSNYVRALKHGLSRLNESFPLSLRLIREIHRILLSGARGHTKQPGQFRQSQNWIGGTRPDNAAFVPPPATHLADCLSAFEAFMHDKQHLTLIRIALLHVQFETIHPFLDGNGRVGRLLITLLLCTTGILRDPILYLSLHFKQQRATYYELLQRVRDKGEWETWLAFFLEGICQTAEDALDTITSINHLFESDSIKISEAGRIRFTCQRILACFQEMPQLSTKQLTEKLNLTTKTARNALKKMCALKILVPLGEGKHKTTFVYKRYLSILEQGAEPL